VLDRPRIIAVLATLDTKGPETEYLARRIRHEWGCRPFVIDLGVLGEPVLTLPWLPDVTRREVACAGGERVEELARAGDRARALAVMSAGAEEVIRRSYRNGRLDAVIGLGGKAGTTMATTAMRALPLGVPKVVVSTMAGGDACGYLGVEDIVLIPSIVDIDGMNKITRQVLSRAAAAVCGMAMAEIAVGDDRPLIAASIFRSTGPCVDACRRQLEAEGLQVLLFQATGAGGRTMESLVEAGFVRGVLDLTTTECADELVGGVLTAGPSRLEAAPRSGTPAVVAPGCLDMVHFFGPETIPQEFRHRNFRQLTDNLTLMRTSPEECAELGQIVAAKLNASAGPVEVYVPLRGVSKLSAPDEPFHDPEADDALFSALRRHLRPAVPLTEVDANINDPAFSKAVTDALLRLVRDAN